MFELPIFKTSADRTDQAIERITRLTQNISKGAQANRKIIQKLGVTVNELRLQIAEDSKANKRMIKRLALSSQKNKKQMDQAINEMQKKLNAVPIKKESGGFFYQLKRLFYFTSSPTNSTFSSCKQKAESQHSIESKEETLDILSSDPSEQQGPSKPHPNDLGVSKRKKI